MADIVPPSASVPESRAVGKKDRRLSLVWVVPIVAVALAAWVAVTKILSEGPTIEIVFQSAEGLEAGKTKIEYNGVEIGTLTSIVLSDDHKNVVTTAQMAPKTDDFLVEDSRFWVVRPRVSGANISGLGTLISGAYIAIDIGQSSTRQRKFTALETPPLVTRDVAGRYFLLKTGDLGSLDQGTPLFFRRIQVGEVTSYKLDQDGQSLNVRVFVNSPYDQYVTANTRFWHASGLDVSLTANGLNIQTQSALSVLIGGVAFETRATEPPLPPAATDSTFQLFASRNDAFKLAAHDPETFVLVFKQAVRGLTPGAPVEFRGIPVGEVTAINAHVDAKTLEFSAPVTIVMDVQRLGVKLTELEPGADFAALRRRLIDHLVANGVRAQLQSGSLLTGAMFVSFDFFPDVAPAPVNWSQQPAQLPTAPGQLEAIEGSLESILKKVEAIPFQAIGDHVQSILSKVDQMPLKAIGDDLHKAVGELDKTLVSATAVLADADQLIDPASGLGPQLTSTLQEVSRAARSLRVLMDYLERHPEALIRGKSGEAQ